MTEEKPKDFKAGFVAITGRPNVGKSTLINQVLGQKITAVTFLPQTTRKTQLGILTQDDVQIIFIDTPGVHISRNKLGERMNAEASEAYNEADVILILVDGSQPLNEEEELIAELLSTYATNIPRILVINKIDLFESDKYQSYQSEYEALFADTEVILISAKAALNIAELVNSIKEKLPEGFPLYPEDQVTDLFEREIAADLIRESALLNLKDEVPHGVAIRIDEFTERSETGAFIRATLFVERESHKGIVIGKAGSMLKKIGTRSRQEIEKMSGRKVFLELKVKVNKNWRNNENVLEMFGFRPKK